MANVELSLTETFHKHKRNLVLLCSVIIVLRIASPSTLKLPFIGADVDLPSYIAFILMGFALIYMSSQYYIEYKTMLARHSSAVVETSNNTIDQVIERHLGKMEGWTSTLDTRQVNINSEALAKELKSGVIDSIIQKYSSSLDQSLSTGIVERKNMQNAMNYSDFDERMSEAMSQLKSHFDKAVNSSTNTVTTALHSIEVRLDEMKPHQDIMAEKISEYNQTYREIATSFKRLSSSIGSAQRVGFRWIDGWLVVIFGGLALIACFTGALGLWIKPPTPIVAVEPGRALPKLVQKPNTTVPTPK